MQPMMLAEKRTLAELDRVRPSRPVVTRAALLAHLVVLSVPLTRRGEDIT